MKLFPVALTLLLSLNLASAERFYASATADPDATEIMNPVEVLIDEDKSTVDHLVHADPLGIAGWVKIDDMEGYALDAELDANPDAAVGTGDWNMYRSADDQFATLPSFSTVADPFGGAQGRVLSLYPGAPSATGTGITTLERALPEGMRIQDPFPATGKATFYFRYARPIIGGVPAQADINWVLVSEAARDVTSGRHFYGSYSVMGRTEIDGIIDIRNGSTYVNATSGPVNTETWYELWFVVDHANNSFTQYIKGGTDFPTQTQLPADGPIDAAYRFATLADLETILFITTNGNQDSLKGRDPVYLDDFHIDVGGFNLTSPEQPSITDPFSLTTSISPEGSGSLSQSGTGIYEGGATATIEATATEGWIFSHWEGAATGSTNPLEVTMDSNKSITAVFLQLYDLTTTVSPEGSGNVSQSGTGTYVEGATATIEAIPSEGWIFNHWEGDVSGSTNPLEITLDSDKEVMAVFWPEGITNNSFEASWELIDGAVSHRLDVAIDDSFEHFVPGFEDLNVGNASIWLVDGLGSGMTYYFRIRGLLPDGTSEVLDIVTVTTVRVIGEKKWEYPIGREVRGRLAVSDDGDIIVSAGSLYSIDGDTGYLNWKSTSSTSSKATPTISSNGLIYVGSNAVDLNTGEHRLNLPFASTDISIGPDNNLIMKATDVEAQRDLIALVNGESGEVIWSITLSLRGNSLRTVSISEDNKVYFTSFYRDNQGEAIGVIWCLDYFTGKELWRFENPYSFLHPPLIDVDGSLYAVSPNSLFHLDGFTGRVIAEVDINASYLLGSEVGMPIITKNRDLIIYGNFLMISFDLEELKVNWEIGTNDVEPRSAVLGADGTVYISDGVGLRSINSETGEILWNLSSSQYSEAVIGDNGSVYVVYDNNLGSFNSSSFGLQDSQWPKNGRNNTNTNYGRNSYVNYEPLNLVIGSQLQSRAISVFSNASWTISYDIPWLSLSIESGSGNETIWASIDENLSGAKREGHLSIGNSLIEIVQFSQPNPVALPATVVSETSFLSNWETVQGATKYLLDVSTEEDFNSFLDGYNQRDTSNSLSWFIDSLTPAIKHYYRISAFDGTDIGPPSNTISVETWPLGYSNWLEAIAPDETDVNRISPTGDFDFDRLDNYYEFVLGTDGVEDSPFIEPKLMAHDGGEVTFTFLADSSLSNGNIYAGVSADMRDWQWVEITFGSGVWNSANTQIFEVLDAQLVTGTDSIWEVSLTLTKENFDLESLFVRLTASSSAL